MIEEPIESIFLPRAEMAERLYTELLEEKTAVDRELEDALKEQKFMSSAYRKLLTEKEFFIALLDRYRDSHTTCRRGSLNLICTDCALYDQWKEEHK